jgi:ligand-binding SRPBCC domain-containing protein
VATPQIPGPHRFRAEQWVAAPVEAVFAFLAQPENLPRLQPAWQRARIEEASFRPPPPRPPSPAAPSSAAPPPRITSDVILRSFAAGPGSRISVSFRPLPYAPIRVPLHATIVEFEWNKYFCDEQEQGGPFALWRHCHRVAAETKSGVSGTRVTDEISYAIRGGVAGALLNKLVIRRMIASTFRHRHAMMTKIFGGPN